MTEIETTDNIISLDLSNKNIKDEDNIFEKLTKFSELEDLHLKNNDLTTLPENLSFLRNLKYLDLSNNHFVEYKKVALSLSTLPNLFELRINLSNHDEAVEILTNLPNLTMLNGKSTKEDINSVDIEGNEIDSIALHNEISNFNDLYLRINDRLKPLGKDSLSSFFNSFQNILRMEIDKINDSMDNSIPNYIYATNVIISKISIYCFFQSKLISMLERRDPDLISILKDTNRLINNSTNSLTEIIFKLNPKIKENAESMRKQYEDAIKDTNFYKAKEFEDKFLQIQKEKDFLLSQAEVEKNMLRDKILQLENENKIMTDKLVRKAKSAISDSIQYDGFKQNTPSQLYNQNQSKANVINSFEDDHTMNIIQNETDKNNTNPNVMSLNKSNNNIIVGPVNCRVLTKKLLLEIIEDIYESKSRFDQKCIETRVPKETMEQHMYTYLNHKYGLKNLIIEWASSIINGIRMYSAEDSEICLFGKILRNELEEESRFIIAKMKNSISDLLAYFLKAKYPLKISNEIKQIADAKMMGLLNEDEWKGIIYNVYEKDDADLLDAKIIEFIQKNLGIIKQNKINKKITREEANNLQKAKDDYRIPYVDFVKILLDYQIKSRDRYLRNFCYLFRKVDSDNNGQLNEDEFVHLLRIMKIYPITAIKENADRLLQVVDPQDSKVISYSDCVNLFSNEFFEAVSRDGVINKVNVLDKISQDGHIL